MTRQLPLRVKQEINDFIRTVGSEIPCAQPSDSQQEEIERVPGDIKKLLLKLIPLSRDNALLDYVQDLNTKDNQDDLYGWLTAISNLDKTNLTNKDLDGDSELFYQGFYSIVFKLTQETDIRFAIQTLNALATFPILLGVEELREQSEKISSTYKRNSAFKDNEGISSYISPEEIMGMLAPKQPRLLWRSKSQSALPSFKTAEYDAILPNKPMPLRHKMN